MSDQPPSGGFRRPLLVKGEQLGRSVDAPATGGGDKFHPRSVDQARGLLLPQVQQAVQQVAALPTRLRSRRIYVEAELLPNYLGASYFPDALLSQIDAEPVGSRAAVGLRVTKARSAEEPTRRLVLAVSDEGLQTFSTIMTTGGSNRSERLAVAEVVKFEQIAVSQAAVTRRDASEVEELTPWEAVLHPDGFAAGEPEPLPESEVAKWFALVSEYGGEVRRDLVRTIGGLTFCPTLLPSTALEEVARFNPLRAVRPMPQLRPFPTSRFRSTPPPAIALPTSTTPRANHARVAVFDGGIDNSHGLFGFGGVALTHYAPEPDGVFHGTAVTAAAMYGLLEAGDTVDSPPLPVDHYRVDPPRDPGDFAVYCVLDEISGAVNSGDYTVINLSYGPDICVDENDEPNRWTSELDLLAYEKEVLFVVAVGNNGEIDYVPNGDRVQVPSDMANGLSVGACTLAEPASGWERAPYSAKGPGRAGNRLQPSVVQFGGVDGNEFPALTPNGTFAEACGTSFATPLVVKSLSEAALLLGTDASPNALRTLAVHFAQPHRAFRARANELGHGRARLSLDEFFECEPYQAHVLYQDEVDRGDVISYRIPLPGGVTGKVALRATLSYMCPVEPSEPTEYTRANLSFVVRPHQFMYSFKNPETDKSDILDVRSADAQAALTAGHKMSSLPVAKTIGRLRSTEAEQREAGKWETVRHYRANFAAEELSEPTIEVSYLARRSGGLDSEPPALTFAMAVTLESEDDTDFYDRVVEEFEVLVPAQATVEVTT